MDRFLVKNLKKEREDERKDDFCDESGCNCKQTTKLPLTELVVRPKTEPELKEKYESGNGKRYSGNEHDETDLKRLKTSPRIRKLTGENLNCDYMKIYTSKEADNLLKRCEESMEYFTGDLARIKVYGKWHDIPRKQVSHGDPGVTYKYSSVTVPAKPWTPLLSEIRDRIQEVTGYKFNFVLINRYADGNDYMGEHRDDEKDLVATSPIASLSLGQHRDFIFRHCEARGAKAKRKIEPVKVELEHGSLLMMNYPTNVYWYHSLPVRKRAHNIRINMTFRDIGTAKK